MTFENIMLARGVLRSRTRGMMGRSVRLSTKRHVGKHTANMASEEMMKGCDPGDVSAVLRQWWSGS